MTIEMFESLIRQRQSCREFDAQKIVPHEHIARIVEAALLSPSACNSQPWFFYAVEGMLAKNVADFTLGNAPDKFTSNASAFVVITEQRQKVLAQFAHRFRDRDFITGDIGIAAAHLVLAAKCLGVDSCIIGSFDELGLNRLLNIDEDKKIKLLVALGYAVKDYPVREKDRFADKPIKFMI